MSEVIDMSKMKVSWAEPQMLNQAYAKNGGIMNDIQNKKQKGGQTMVEVKKASYVLEIADSGKGFSFYRDYDKMDDEEKAKHKRLARD